MHTEGSCKLKETVLLSYNDIAAAGSRAMLSLDVQFDDVTLDVGTLTEVISSSSADVKCACVLEPGAAESSVDDHRTLRPVQIFNCKNEQISIIVVNTVVSGSKCHLLLNEILNICTNSHVKRLIVVSALHLTDSALYDVPLYENCLNCAQALRKTSPPLPLTTAIHDPFLSTLLQMSLVDGLPTNFLIVPAHRTRIGKMGNETKREMMLLQEAVQTSTGLKFDKQLSSSLLYKGDEDEDGNLSSMIYL